MTQSKKNKITKSEITNRSNAMGDALKNVAKIGSDYQSMAEQMSPILNAIKALPPIQNSIVDIVQKISEERKDLFESIWFHTDEVIKAQSVMEMASKNIGASAVDIKTIAEMTNSTSTTLRNLQSLGAIGTISAYNYLKQLSTVEESEFEGLEDATDSEIEIIEPYKSVPPEIPVNHPISQDEFRALQKHHNHEMGLLKEKIAELETLVAQRKGVERTSSRGANQETREKITKLVEFRNEEIKRKKIAPQKLNACQSIPIDSKTVQKYASKLWKNWKDTSYQWDGIFDD